MNVAVLRARGESAPAVALRERLLVVTFPDLVRAASWAIVNGGIRDVTGVAVLEVRDEELRPPVNAESFLTDRLAREHLGLAVGLMTSREVSTYAEVSAEALGVRATAIATVGLGNALRAGDPPGPSGRVGTINVVVHVDAPLSDTALLESLALSSEAKAAAMLDAGIPSRRTGLPATGTGTDCSVVTAPRARSCAAYAGKHTATGAAVGQAVFEAVSRGITRWVGERS